MIDKASDTVVIFSSAIARALIKKGFVVSDIAPDMKDPERKRTIFFFKNENNITEAANALIGKDRKNAG